MNTIYGYCRISRKEQNIDRQERNIKAAYPAAIIVKESCTGTKIDRPEWSRLVNHLNAGDTVVFDSVSRMSRNAAEGWTAYRELLEKGVSLCFIKEPQIDTAVYLDAMQGGVAMTGTDADLILQGVNAYLFRLAERQVQLAFEQAEKEVEDLHQRTREGIETARLAGKQIGQKEGAKLTTKKSIAAKETIKKHYKRFGGTLDAEECAKLAGISRNSFFKYCKELCSE